MFTQTNPFTGLDTETDVSTFPRQKITYSEKVKDDNSWGKKCIDAAISSIDIQNRSKRSSKLKKIRNYNLFNGKFDKSDMEVTVQPLSMMGYTFPAELQYRDIISPIFYFLFGEEARRGTSFVLRSLNEDSISEKEEKKKKDIQAILLNYLNSQQPQQPQQQNQESQENQQNQQQEQLSEEELKKLEKYYSYDYKDMRERLASHLLNYLYTTLHLNGQFSKAWEDAMLAGEELYEIDIISREPIARRQNPLELSFILSHNSDFIDNAEIIVKDEYYPISKIIDEYWEVLEDNEIDELESTNDSYLWNNFSLAGNASGFVPLTGDLSKYANQNSSSGDWSNEKGEIRVSKVIWKSKKLIGELIYIDENGTQQKTYVPDNFKEDKNNPNYHVNWFWINEYWEGTRIKDKIYKNIRPRKLQYRKMDNISECKSGFVGTIYSANNSESVSFMDRLVPWIYTYITLWYRLDLLMAANIGKIGLIDVSLMPDGWEMEKWLYYASIMKIRFVNSFNEGKKGQSTGKLAGSSTQNKTLDLSTGNEIQGYIQILEYIEKKIQDISGITRQRLGTIAPSDLVGNTQASINQSSIITEKYYQIHNAVKQRVLEALIETAKVAYRDDIKKLQYITDDLSTIFFTYDGNQFTNDQYGIVVSDSYEDIQILTTVKQLAQAAIQNDKTELSTIFNVLSTKSISEIKSTLKHFDNKVAQNQQAQFQAEQINKQEILKIEQQKIDNDNWNKEQDRQTKLRIAEIQGLSYEKDTEKGATQIINQAKLALEERKQSFIEHQAQEQNSQDRESARLKEKDIKTKAQIKREEIRAKNNIKNTNNTKNTKNIKKK